MLHVRKLKHEGSKIVNSKDLYRFIKIFISTVRMCCPVDPTAFMPRHE